MLKKLIVCSSVIFFCCANLSISYAQDEGLGQIIHINTNFNSFVGNAQWLLIIRDIDHNQNIPYLYDFQLGDNAWMAFTNSSHYLITVSELQITKFRYCCNDYRTYKIKNFCHLESNGRIIRRKSLYVTINGGLAPYSHSYSCQVTRYFDPTPQLVAQSQ